MEREAWPTLSKSRKAKAHVFPWSIVVGPSSDANHHVAVAGCIILTTNPDKKVAAEKAELGSRWGDIFNEKPWINHQNFSASRGVSHTTLSTITMTDRQDSLGC